MRFEKLLEPVSEDQPCGPDLDEEGDDDYLNYIFAAEERLPTRFFDDEQNPFDKSGVDLDAEVKVIAGLLERSRDLRLLTLEARFQILRGEIVGFCECVIACAQLTEKFWDHIHPGAEGDMQLRQNTVAALDSLVTCVLPMQFAPIVRDRRNGDVTLRQFVVANGEAEPREDEKVRSPAAITDALGNAGNSDVVEATYTALNGALESFEKLKATFIEHVDHELVPFFDQTAEATDQLVKLIEKARPDLGGDAGTEESSGVDDGEDDSEADESAEDVVVESSESSSAKAGDITSHAAATAALTAAELYFSSNEPTSPALLLVHQARTLVGQPLVVALEALMPETVERAGISFDSSMKVQLDINRMRTLSGETSYGEPAGGDGEIPDFSAATRAEATQILGSVENFFRGAEPSSPIPMLLQKARGYLNRDFSSILSDLIPTESTESE